MDKLYITHYYFKDTDPWKNIMNLSKEDAFKKAAELADEHPDTTSFGRLLISLTTIRKELRRMLMSAENL